jgi:hypothetical protein
MSSLGVAYLLQAHYTRNGRQAKMVTPKRCARVRRRRVKGEMAKKRWNAGNFGLHGAVARKIFGLVLPMALATGMVASSDATAAEDIKAKTIIGRTEKVWIAEAGIVLDAKIDTGTLTASINARDIEVFTKSGKDWARFVIESSVGKPITLERQVVRFARFKKQNQEVERRPIVKLGLCLGDVYRRTEVNLTDRERFTYPVLIGRSFLSGKLVVDIDKEFTRPPQCTEMDRKGG